MEGEKRTKGGHRVKYLEVSKSLGGTSDTESNEPGLQKTAPALKISAPFLP